MESDGSLYGITATPCMESSRRETSFDTRFARCHARLRRNSIQRAGALVPYQATGLSPATWINERKGQLFPAAFSTNWNLLNYFLLTIMCALSISIVFTIDIEVAPMSDVILSRVSGYTLILRVPISIYSLWFLYDKTSDK